MLAATNKELTAEVAAHRFRADLYYRLNVVTITLPPLRDRRDRHSHAGHDPAGPTRPTPRQADRRGSDNAAIRGLMAAPWRGNVRELDNALERAVILAEGPVLTPEDFPAGLLPDRSSIGDPSSSTADDLRAALRDYERTHVLRVLDESGDDKREASRRLGLGLSSLYRKLDEFGLR